MINETLAKYDASINAEGFIVLRGVTFTVKIVRYKQLLRFENLAGQLLSSGPIAPSTVENFVEKFWFWKKGETK